VKRVQYRAAVTCVRGAVPKYFLQTLCTSFIFSVLHMLLRMHLSCPNVNHELPFCFKLDTAIYLSIPVLRNTYLPSSIAIIHQCIIPLICLYFSSSSSSCSYQDLCHFLTRSDLTHPEASLLVFLGSFCLLGYSCLYFYLCC
jgi:hypothetical protein